MGKLTLILGPMFSGKTTELLRFIERYELLGKRVLVVNHARDQRYGTGVICTHSRMSQSCVAAETVREAMGSGAQAPPHLLAIDEGQFFPDLLDTVTSLLARHPHMHVVVSGLNGDFQRKPMGRILELIPHAEEVIQLHALCMDCGDGTLADFSKRSASLSLEQVMVGSGEAYRAVCRKHYDEPSA